MTTQPPDNNVIDEDFETPVYDDHERPDDMNPPAHRDDGNNPGLEDPDGVA